MLEDDIAPDEEFESAWIYCTVCECLTNHWSESHDYS